MTPSPADRQHHWFGVALVIVASVTALGWKSFSAKPPPAIVPPEVVQLATLAHYLAPSADSGTVAVARRETIVLPRDPFNPAASPKSPPATIAGEAPSDPTKAEGTELIVNAVMITGSYRGAVINDVLINLGGRLPDGARLTKVERDHVEFTDSRGTKRTVRVRDGDG